MRSSVFAYGLGELCEWSQQIVHIISADCTYELGALYHVGAVLADRMGLGKTHSIINFIHKFSKPMPTLIVVPCRLLRAWRREFSTWKPSLLPRLHQYPPPTPPPSIRETRQHNLHNLLLPTGKSILLVSYETFWSARIRISNMTSAHVLHDLGASHI